MAQAVQANFSDCRSDHSYADYLLLAEGQPAVISLPASTGSCGLMLWLQEVSATATAEGVADALDPVAEAPNT
jgi:hypothetical protein